MGQNGFYGGKKKFDPKIAIILGAAILLLIGFNVVQNYLKSIPDNSGDTQQLLTYLEYKRVELNELTNLQITDDYVVVDGKKIKFKCSSVDFSVLAKCPAIQYIDIRYVNVKNDCKGIENLNWLSSLTINNSNLASVEEIAKCSGIIWLEIRNNYVTDIGALEIMPNLYYVNIKGNSIWEHRPLRNVPVVDMWDEDCVGPYGIATRYRDENSRQIYVAVKDLVLRTAPKRGDKSNLTGEYALKGGYYYILDNVWADDYLWVKVGNDIWMATKEGDWTYLYE